MSIAMVWPLALVVLSNIVYQITTKMAPSEMSPFASLTVTYGIATVLSLLLFFVTTKDTSLIKEYAHVNWATIVLSFAIVGLETGYIYAFKAGWQISTLSTIQGAILAIALVFVGYVLFKEGINSSKIIGIAACLIGLYFLNK